MRVYISNLSSVLKKKKKKEPQHYMIPFSLLSKVRAEAASEL